MSLLQEHDGPAPLFLSFAGQGRGQVSKLTPLPGGGILLNSGKQSNTRFFAVDRQRRERARFPLLAPGSEGETPPFLFLRAARAPDQKSV
jgi:hypothetical protein